MSEMELGGNVKLTVPQLRVYLGCMQRLAEIYGKMDQVGAPHKADGINFVVFFIFKNLAHAPSSLFSKLSFDLSIPKTNDNFDAIHLGKSPPLPQA